MSLNNVFFESGQETHNSSKNANFLTFCFSFSSATKPRDCRAGQLFLYRLTSTRPALTSVFNGITRAGPCGSHDKKIYWKTSKPINVQMRKSKNVSMKKYFLLPSFLRIKVSSLWRQGLSVEHPSKLNTDAGLTGYKILRFISLIAIRQQGSSIKTQLSHGIVTNLILTRVSGPNLICSAGRCLLSMRGPRSLRSEHFKIKLRIIFQVKLNPLLCPEINVKLT